MDDKRCIYGSGLFFFILYKVDNELLDKLDDCGLGCKTTFWMGCVSKSGTRITYLWCLRTQRHFILR